MSKRTIAMLYIIGIITEIIATIAFFVCLSGHISATASYESNVNSCISEFGIPGDPSATQNLCNGEPDRSRMSEYQGGMVTAAVFMVLAGMLSSIAWIGTLVNLSRAQAWPWFILTFFFGGIMVFIYLVGSPSPLQTRQYPHEPSNASFGIHPPPTSQAYPPQPPRPLSPLGILQQRYAHGEIDTPTFQQMRALLETPSRPNP